MTKDEKIDRLIGLVYKLLDVITEEPYKLGKPSNRFLPVEYRLDLLIDELEDYLKGL